MDIITNKNRKYDVDGFIGYYQNTDSNKPYYTENSNLIGKEVPSTVNLVNGVAQWGNLVANANDIIEWNGAQWVVVFNSQQTNTLTYITNAYTGVQYKWDGTQWTKSMEGVYPAGKWQIIL